MVGVIMLVLGLLKAGTVMDFVSNAVMTAFTLGIALQIITCSRISLTDRTPYDNVYRTTYDTSHASRRPADMPTTETPRTPMTFRTVIPFFAMAFGLSWGLAALAILFADQLEPIFGPIGLTNPLFFIAVYAPAISGIGLVLRHYGVGGLRSYLRRLTLWRMPTGWAFYLVLGIPAAFYLGAWIKGSDLSFPFDPWYTVLPALLLMLALGPMEEFGWRGVALPLLQRRFRPIGADLILSVLWAVWHLPAFFMSGTPQSQWSFPVFFVGVVSISWILTPLFNAAHGSILIAAIYHFQMNNPIWPDAQPYDSLLFAGIAVLAVVVNRRAMFSRTAGVTSVLMPGDEDLQRNGQQIDADALLSAR